MGVAELPTHFDSGQMRAEAITLGHGSRKLKIELGGQTLIDLHTA